MHMIDDAALGMEDEEEEEEIPVIVTTSLPQPAAAVSPMAFQFASVASTPAGSPTTVAATQVAPMAKTMKDVVAKLKAKQQPAKKALEKKVPTAKSKALDAAIVVPKTAAGPKASASTTLPRAFAVFTPVSAAVKSEGEATPVTPRLMTPRTTIFSATPKGGASQPKAEVLAKAVEAKPTLHAKPAVPRLALSKTVAAATNSAAAVEGQDDDAEAEKMFPHLLGAQAPAAPLSARSHTSASVTTPKTKVWRVALSMFFHFSICVCVSVSSTSVCVLILRNNFFGVGTDQLTEACGDQAPGISRASAARPATTADHARVSPQPDVGLVAAVQCLDHAARWNGLEQTDGIFRCPCARVYCGQAVGAPHAQQPWWPHEADHATQPQVSHRSATQTHHG